MTNHNIIKSVKNKDKNDKKINLNIVIIFKNDLDFKIIIIIYDKLD